MGSAIQLHTKEKREKYWYAALKPNNHCETNNGHFRKWFYYSRNSPSALWTAKASCPWGRGLQEMGVHKPCLTVFLCSSFSGLHLYFGQCDSWRSVLLLGELFSFVSSLIETLHLLLSCVADVLLGTFISRGTSWTPT